MKTVVLRRNSLLMYRLRPSSRTNSRVKLRRDPECQTFPSVRSLLSRKKGGTTHTSHLRTSNRRTETHDLVHDSKDSDVKILPICQYYTYLLRNKTQVLLFGRLFKNRITTGMSSTRHLYKKVHNTCPPVTRTLTFHHPPVDPDIGLPLYAKVTPVSSHRKMRLCKQKSRLVTGFTERQIRCLS